MKAEVTIRAIEPSDAEAMQRIFSQASVYGNTMQLPYPSAAIGRKRTQSREGKYSLVACVDGDVIGEGHIYAIPRPRRRHVGALAMQIDEAWQGKGVGTRLMEELLNLADNWLNLRRVELEVFTDNAAGVALYKKFGFEIEGTLRDYAYRNGAYVDAYVMSRIREDRA